MVFVDLNLCYDFFMRVILFGYYGFQNTGDEQLLDESIRLLKELKTDIDYVLIT